MQALNIVVFQHDPRLAQALASTLSLHYHSVHVAGSLEELRVEIPRHRADVAVLDVEASHLEEVERLHALVFEQSHLGWPERSPAVMPPPVPTPGIRAAAEALRWVIPKS